MSQGFAPQNGFELIEGRWAKGIVQGVNWGYLYGISAAGTTQADATAIPSNFAMYQVDTAAASSGIALPQAIQGTKFDIYNNGASTLTVYPAVKNNPATSAQDTINTTLTSITVNSHSHLFVFCPKSGNWSI